ncbi:MAG: preprotein translocase subunit SecG [Robiginitomaculum sp.]|nr:preprotein translocase subunit SecG [Robiginitomaculum sp.]MDQ7077183.1 preprotein translocase subunit SecG [Robiginitomaculum sp.]
MTTVLLTIHFLISVALVATVLLQRSEGGALGMGGGPGSMMSGRGAADVLTRSTSILGAMFFTTSILLTVVPNLGKSSDSVVIGAPVSETTDTLTKPVPAPEPAASETPAAEKPTQAPEEE